MLQPTSCNLQAKRGITLIETLIGVVVLVIISAAIYQSYTAVLDTYQTAKVKAIAADVINEEIEFIRSVPYSQIGLVGGVPSGVVAATSTVSRETLIFMVNRYIRNEDDPFDGMIGGTPNDLSPADYKLIEIEVHCIACSDPELFSATARIAPSGLETGSSNGALFVRAIDASGIGVSSATVNIQNSTTNPTINVTDVTDGGGWLRIVDAPPANESYEITISKTGFSSDQTYTSSIGNPNPSKPHATVALQTVTQATFLIDNVGQLNFSSTNQSCGGIGTVDFDLDGSKLIGTSPNVLKYEASHTTDNVGNRIVSNLEWDNYAVMVTDTNVSLIGMNPLSPINLPPDTTQNVTMIIHTKNPNELLVTVKDSVTGLPVPNALVGVTRVGYDEAKTTGVGFLGQTDWSGGAGQMDFSDPTQYYLQDGNIDITNPAGDLKLVSTNGVYAPNGNLESSTFDTGGNSVFNTVSWNPGTQSPETGADSVAIQIATGNDPATTTWEYLGPNGTDTSFYTLSNPNIHPIHDGDRYIKYKVYLSTASTTFTPTFSDFQFTFSASCIPSGQVLFDGISLATYTIDVTKVGYQPFNEDVILLAPWQEHVVSLIPQ
ncbi:MAG: hypothetical protein COU08_04530 [Candidatus Harrisonbacteria bacterium CG10_big_fil_rev_8_21_14_0_10_42_17]|uniref:Uncharacterized protein n=1 Tax=Candidatus Harrisonbacteria bacterium CG10_big_fil_rev_8_21_14_0_10_42_17 TaxID=1974584 RepID=A0A2M6WH13_9BACT|nr:MAG: hypothetical protein COU08_04530 [Candidatus Harrisonbacteria bacterium CG10_big_fil_rev_8_21_14_0_10_42_17]